MAMKVYTIIGGVNGAGKSSLTGALKAERNDLGIIIVEAAEYKNGEIIPKGERLPQWLRKLADALSAI
jgi:predicted ABC-type ATPase